MLSSYCQVLHKINCQRLLSSFTIKTYCQFLLSGFFKFILKPFQKAVNSPATVGNLILFGVSEFPESYALVLENRVVSPTACASFLISDFPFNYTRKNKRLFSGLTIPDNSFKISCPVSFPFHKLEHFWVPKPVLYKTRVRAWKAV